MGDDRISPVHNLGIVSPLIEHTHIQPQHIGIVDGALHPSLVRRNDHHMVLVDIQVRDILEEGLDELVAAGDIVKGIPRNRVHDPRIMRVEGDEILHSHAVELLQHHRAVQGLPAGSFVLAGLIHKGHDDIDPLRLPGGRRDQPLQIRVMIVRRHMIYMAEDRIGDGVIHDIHKEIDVHAAHSLQNLPLRLPRAEAADLRRNDVIVLLIAIKGNRVLVLTLPLRSPRGEIAVDSLSQGLYGLKRHQSQRTDRNPLDELGRSGIRHLFSPLKAMAGSGENLWISS